MADNDQPLVKFEFLVRTGRHFAIGMGTLPSMRVVANSHGSRTSMSRPLFAQDLGGFSERDFVA